MKVKKSTIYELEFDAGIISEGGSGLTNIDVIETEKGCKKIEDAIELIEELEMEEGNPEKIKKEFVIIGKIARRYSETERET